MKNEAVCGAAAPRMRRMLLGALISSCTWFRNDPATNVARNIVTTCAMHYTCHHLCCHKFQQSPQSAKCAFDILFLTTLNVSCLMWHSSLRCTRSVQGTGAV